MNSTSSLLNFDALLQSFLFFFACTLFLFYSLHSNQTPAQAAAAHTQREIRTTTVTNTLFVSLFIARTIFHFGKTIGHKIDINKFCMNVMPFRPFSRAQKKRSATTITCLNTTRFSFFLCLFFAL